jgi:PilZ domain.
MGIPAHIKEIAIQVHSIDYVLKCRVCSISENELKFAPLEKEADMFQVNEPVVIMYMEEGYLQFESGDIIGVDMTNNIVELHIIDFEINEERRIFERYPVSMAVSARRKFSNKRLFLVAKNISQYGMQAISKAELDVDESVDIDLITGKFMFYFVGKVVWKEPKGSSYEYGFQLTNFDVSTKNLMEAYLSKLKDEYKSMYTKAK